MEDNIRFDGYMLVLGKSGTYTAKVYFGSKEPKIKIVEEYNEIPVTLVIIEGYIDEAVKTVCVPKTVKELINGTIYQYNLPFFVEVSPENPWLCSDDKAVFSKDKTILYSFTAREDKSYTIPDGVRIIYGSAFYGAYVLNELTMPDTLEEIGQDVFFFCGVRNWKFPKGLKKIDSWALHSVVMDSCTLPESIEDMADDAFEIVCCSSPVYLPDCFNNPKFNLPDHSFAPEYIIDENSRTLTQIDGVIYTKDMKVLLAISKTAPSRVIVPDGVEIIAVQASCSNSKIKEVILPSSVHTISAKAFHGSRLEKINLENVKVIEEQAFEQCEKLCETGDIGAEVIGFRSFADTALKIINLTHIKELGVCAFENVKDGAEVHISEGLETIERGALERSKFSLIRIPRNVCMLENSIPQSAKVIELYDVPNSIIYKKDPKINNFHSDCVIKVLSPETDEVKYAVTIFKAEETEDVKNSVKFISSLFGGDQFFDLEKYDKYYRTVYNQNNILSKYKAAYYRMKYPAGITDYTREMYMTYLQFLSPQIIRFILNKQDVTVDEIRDFPYISSVDEENLLELIDRSSKKGLVEITAFLMNQKHIRFPNSGQLSMWEDI